MFPADASSTRLPVTQPSPISLLRSDQVSHVERRVAGGELVRVVRGIYATKPNWDGLAPWQRYLARVHAVALTHPDAVFALESACALWGLPVFGDPVVVHMLGGPDSTARLSAGTRIHASRALDRIELVGGMRLTDPAATAVDMARTRHPAIALAVGDAALRRFPIASRSELQDLNESRPSKRGRRIARWALARADALVESPLEAVSLAVIEWLGFEAPQLQVEFITGSVTDRVDMWWKVQRVIGEADGELKYDGTLGTNPATTVRNEKHRDRRLRHHCDGLAHWGWSDAISAWPLRDVLMSAGLEPIAPPDTAQLTSLRTVLRTGDPA
jgi:hypothetical protein